eukprot:SAG22_NODE_10299_length_542_cov_1.397291_1_plen_118_part_10
MRRDITSARRACPPPPPNFLESPALYGADTALMTTWMGLVPTLVAEIGAAQSPAQSNLDAAGAVALLGPGLCTALIASNPDICATQLNAAVNPLSALSLNHGLCDYVCPCQCARNAEC